MRAELNILYSSNTCGGRVEVLIVILNTPTFSLVLYSGGSIILRVGFYLNKDKESGQIE